MGQYLLWYWNFAKKADMIKAQNKSGKQNNFCE